MKVKDLKKGALVSFLSEGHWIGGIVTFNRNGQLVILGLQGKYTFPIENEEVELKKLNIKQLKK